MKFDPKINNLKWQIILIPVISFIVCLFISYNVERNFNDYEFPKELFFTLCCFIFIIWRANLLIYKILDEKLAFYESPVKRLGYQIIFCSFTTWGTFLILYVFRFFFLNGTFNGIFRGNFLQFFVIATIISIFINCFYIIKYLQYSLFYNNALSAEKLNSLLKSNDEKKQDFIQVANAETPEIVLKNNSMVVETGNKMMTILFEDMAYWFSSEGLVTLVLTNSKKITTNFSSLVPVVDKLPSLLFFQLSRQFITHVQSISVISGDENRKLVVELLTKSENAKVEKVTVSRYRSIELKKWFSQNLAKA